MSFDTPFLIKRCQLFSGQDILNSQNTTHTLWSDSIKVLDIYVKIGVHGLQVIFLQVFLFFD